MAKLRVDKIASVGVSTETTGSVFFDGTGDYLNVAENGDDFTFGTGGFTIEFWVYRNNADDVVYFDWRNVSGNQGARPTIYSYDSQLRYFSGVDRITAPDLSTNTWHHVVVCRTGTSTKMFVNGSQVGSTYTDSTTYLSPQGSEGIYIGAFAGGSYDLNGYISNFRICKGHAVYKSNFAVPTRELDVHPGPDDDRTVFLGLYDGENIFADKTGRHIIAAYGDRSSTPTPASTDSPIGITTLSPGLDRDVDNTFGPTFQGGAGYASQNWLTLPKGTTTDRNRTGGRAVFGGGTASPGSSNLNSIEFISITTQGNAQDFGDLIGAARTKSGGGVSSPTRGVTAGGYDSDNVSRIEYVNISSTGNSVNFGATLSTAGRNLASASNSTRGLFFGGDNRATEIDFITIASLGTRATFGTIPSPGNANVAGLASPTRAVFGGGYRSGAIDKIEYVTISTTGNAVDFGDVTVARFDPGACSSSTRGIFAGGSVTSPTSARVDVIDYITIATTGNAQDFGDLIAAKASAGGTSNSIRGVFAGDQPAFNNAIEFITIATTGNANDFGDLVVGRGQAWSCSDSHGGIS